VSQELVAAGADLEVTIVEYRKHPPDRAALEHVVSVLEDPVADLVRKDSLFDKLGLSAADYVEPGPVIELLLAHKMLLQRPLIVRDDAAIIGRPKERVRAFLAG
jgi:arsenate reductase